MFKKVAIYICSLLMLECAYGVRLLAYSKVETLDHHKHRVRLTHLNPHINKWFILSIKSGRRIKRYHIENPDPSYRLHLAKQGIELIKESSILQKYCPLWAQNEFDINKLKLKDHKDPYYSICDGSLYIRLKKPSNTQLSFTEQATRALRNVSFGEQIINQIKPFIVDYHAESEQAKIVADDGQSLASLDYPEPAMTKLETGRALASHEHQMGIAIRNSDEDIAYGQWYETSMHQGIFTSLFLPQLMDKEVIKKYKDRLYPVTKHEMDKLIYLIAYDLGQYSANYVVGTQQPPVNTSQKLYKKRSKLRKSLVGIGTIPPYERQNAVGVFIGGFKQRHSQIKYGPLKGKTYGAIENGVELQPMSANLATFSVSKYGDVKIGRWPSIAAWQKKARKETMSARQNGTLILDDGQPGPYIKKWKQGNWSADATGLRRSLRSGVCIQKREDKNFLVFMAFTAATPSTMAQVMMSYGCSNGMHLDMNALMYLHNAIYKVDDEHNLIVQYLNKEMLYPPDLKIHRFIMDNNNRDFFYIKKRSSKSVFSNLKHDRGKAGMPKPTMKSSIPVRSGSSF